MTGKQMKEAVAAPHPLKNALGCYTEGRRNAKPAGISEKVIRLLEIYSIIARKEFPSPQDLAQRFNVSERTVYRYLELINMIDAIQFDGEEKGYRFTHGDRIKKMTLSDQELILLFAAGEAVTHFGATFQDNFQELMARMVATTKRDKRKEAKIPILIKIPDAVRSHAVDQTLRSVMQCASERRSVEITYRAQHNKEITHRIVDPYGLIFYEGTWILVGFCHLRKKIRSFALDRVIELKERYLYFTPRDGFDLEGHLSHSWGVFDAEEVGVTVRFGVEVSDYIKRKEKWHVSEKRKVLPDGTIELSFFVAGVDEIKRWIYSWLPHAEVLKPDWLREQIHKELGVSSKTHSG